MLIILALSFLYFNHLIIIFNNNITIFFILIRFKVIYSIITHLITIILIYPTHLINFKFDFNIFK